MKTGPVIAIVGIFVAVALPILSFMGGNAPLAVKIAASALSLFILCTLFAAVRLTNPWFARRVRRRLRQEKYQGLYHLFMDGLLVRARLFFDIDEPPDHASWARLFRWSWTYGLVDRCLLLGVAYPVLLLFVFWGVSGQDGKLGDVPIIPGADPYWTGLATLAISVVVLVLPFLDRWLETKQVPFQKILSDWLIPSGFLICSVVMVRLNQGEGAFTVACAYAATLALSFAFGLSDNPARAVMGASASICASAIAAVIALAFAFAEGGMTIVVGIAVGGAVAFTVLVATRILRLLERHPALSACIAIALPICLMLSAALLITMSGDRYPSTARVVFLFLGILPIFNAIFDMVSYAITLSLAQRGLRGHALVYGAIDFVVACILFFVLGAWLVFATSALENLSGIEFIDLGGVLAQAGSLNEYWWLYLMLFSTALPTLLHLMIASFSLQTFVPLKYREKLARLIVVARRKRGNEEASIVVSLCLGGFWMIGMLLPLALLGLLGWLCWEHGLEWLLVSYRDFLLDVAIWAGGV